MREYWRKVSALRQSQIAVLLTQPKIQVDRPLGHESQSNRARSSLIIEDITESKVQPSGDAGGIFLLSVYLM
jgi:hypothetical protein